MIKKVEINECTCEGCGHVWISRKVEVPLVCPRCGNRRWNKNEDGKPIMDDSGELVLSESE